MSVKRYNSEIRAGGTPSAKDQMLTLARVLSEVRPALLH